MQTTKTKKVGRPKMYPSGLKMTTINFKVPNELKKYLQSMVNQELKKYREKYNQIELF